MEQVVKDVILKSRHATKIITKDNALIVLFHDDELSKDEISELEKLTSLELKFLMLDKGCSVHKFD